MQASFAANTPNTANTPKSCGNHESMNFNFVTMTFLSIKKKMVLIYFVKEPTGLVPHFKLIHVHGTCTPRFSCPTGGDNFGSKNSNGTYRPIYEMLLWKKKCRIGRNNHIKPTWTFALSLLSFVGMFNLELDNLRFKFVLNIKIGPRTVLRCFYKSFMPSCFERFGAHWPHLSLMHESYSITLFSSYFFF